jgi:hypothetical protein
LKQSHNGLLNLYVPIAYGGLGFNFFKGFKPQKVTFKQRLLVEYNKERLKHQKKPITINYEMRFYRDLKAKGLPELLKKDCEGINSSYYSDKISRELAGDDWISSMSREKFRNKGLMICENLKIKTLITKMMKHWHRTRLNSTNFRRKTFKFFPEKFSDGFDFLREVYLVPLSKGTSNETVSRHLKDLRTQRICTGKIKRDPYLTILANKSLEQVKKENFLNAINCRI